MHGALKVFGHWSCLLGVSLCVTACAPILAIVGYSQPAIQVAVQIDRIKLIGDGVSYVGSGKTISDHALSLVAGADCRIFNVASRKPVCASTDENTAPPADVKLSTGPATEPTPQMATRPAPETGTPEIAAAQDLPADSD